MPDLPIPPAQAPIFPDERIRAYEMLRWFGEHPHAAQYLQDQQMDRTQTAWRPGPVAESRFTDLPVNPFNLSSPPDFPREWTKESCPFCGK